eukprot:7384821-Prymnesium_polylepis.2
MAALLGGYCMATLHTPRTQAGSFRLRSPLLYHNGTILLSCGASLSQARPFRSQRHPRAARASPWAVAAAVAS